MADYNVGYGVIFVFSILGVVLLLSIPKLLISVTHIFGAKFPTSALTLIALCFIVFLLVYILTQVTLVADRLPALIQELAIERAGEMVEKESMVAAGPVTKAE